jgi:hypothetical protein
MGRASNVKIRYLHHQAGGGIGRQIYICYSGHIRLGLVWEHRRFDIKLQDREQSGGLSHFC